LYSMALPIEVDATAVITNANGIRQGYFFTE
jgi:hypothetical protein